MTSVWRIPVIPTRRLPPYPEVKLNNKEARDEVFGPRDHPGFFLLIPVSGIAATYYVDATTGDDAHTSTQAQNPSTPWKTISHAAGAVPAGSPGTPNIIQVAAGTYDAALGEVFPVAVVNADVSLLGAGAASTTIDGGGTATIVNLQQRGATLQSFTFDDATTAIDADIGGFTISNNVFSNDPDFAIGIGVSYVANHSASANWSAGDVSIIDNEFNVATDGVFFDVLADGNTLAIDVDLGAMTVESNTFRGTGAAGGLDINRIAATNVSGGSVTVGVITIHQNGFNDGGDGVHFAGSLTNMVDTAVAVGAVNLTQNTFSDPSGYAITLDHYNISQWSGSTTGALGRVLLTSNNVANTVGQGILISDIGPWQYLSGDASVLFGGVSISDTNSVSVNAGNGITINYNNISYLSGNASATLGPISVIDSSTITAPAIGLHIKLTNVGRQLTEQAAVSLGDVTVSNNPFDTVSQCLYYEYDYVGMIMSGTTGFTAGQLIITDNTLDSETWANARIEFSSNGEQLADSATVEVGDMVFRGNTVISPSGSGLYLGFDRIGYNVDGDSQVTWGQVLIGGPQPTEANSFPTGGGINTTYDDIAYDMEGYASLEMGDLWIENNSLLGGGEVEIEFYDEVGYELYGNASATLPTFHIVGNTIDAGNNTYAISFESDYGHGYLYDDAVLDAGGFEVADNVIGFGSSSYAMGVSYYPDYFTYNSVEDNSRVTLGDIVVDSNVFDATTQTCIAIYLPNLAPNQYGSSTVEVGNIEVTNNQIGSTQTAIDLDIDTDGAGNGTVTVGDVKISGNTIDGIASGDRGINIEYDLSPADTSTATIGRTLIQLNTLNGGAGEDGIRLLFEEFINPGATGVIGQLTVAMNTIESFSTGIYLDDFDDVSIINNTITGNVDGIWATIDSVGHTISQNNLYGNSNAAVTNLATTWIDAEDNWWGDASGPYDSIGTIEVPPCTGNPVDEVNSDGLGDDSGDYVAYCPWATEPFAPPLIFIDGFETGTTDSWDSVTP